jgi:hypothetical protein
MGLLVIHKWVTHRVMGMGTKERTRTRFTRWVRFSPVNVPVRGKIPHTRTLIGFLPAG